MVCNFTSYTQLLPSPWVMPPAVRRPSEPPDVDECGVLQLLPDADGGRVAAGWRMDALCGGAAGAPAVGNLLARGADKEDAGVGKRKSCGVLERKCAKCLAERKKGCNFAAQKPRMVPWMSGLVNGLQNRLRRFESARHLLTEQRQAWVDCYSGLIFSAKRLLRRTIKINNV